MASGEAALPAGPACAEAARGAGWRFFRLNSRVLAAVTWLSCGLFGAYILAFYAAALATGHAARWNGVLPGLYEAARPLSTAGMGLHFAAGGVVLAFGFVQLLGRVRERAPAVHRWLGRVYVSAAVLAGVGGLVFIAGTGTIGGRPMDVGFGLYGVLMIVAAVQAWRQARRRRLDAHRRWALRLFALAVGSWLYRMEYGFWFLVAHRLGHTGDFHGPFDLAMAFFFYVPNLLVVEAYLRGRTARAGTAGRIAAGAAMGLAACLLVVATYVFATRYWWPAVAGG